jgi:aspartate/methionine/tyrosine aminotransferase
MTMKPLSQAIVNAKKSSIRRLFALVLEARNAISFGIGQPDFGPSPPVLEAVKAALDRGVTGYAPAQGIPPALEAVAQKFREENAMSWVTPDHVILANGGSQGIQLAYDVLTNPGDEVIVNSPGFLSYYYMCDFTHTRCVEVPLQPDYSLDVNAILEAITPQTKLIVLNSPSNPTGYTCSEAEIKAVVDACIDHDLYLFSDEVYEHFLYEGARHISPASYPGMEDRTVTLNAMSKTFGGTGLRLGYLAASPDIIQNMEKYIQYCSAGVNHPMQYALLEALKLGNAELPTIVAKYDKKRRFAVKRLQELGFETPIPTGAFYIMPKVSPFGLDSDEFSMALMKHGEVAVVPGSAFGSFAGDAIRISFATTDENLEEGFNRIERFVGSL